MKHIEKRIIQMGENPECVFNVGALGIEAINNMNFLSKDAICKELGISDGQPYILMTYIDYNNPYGVGNTSELICELIKNYLKSSERFPYGFYDLK